MSASISLLFQAASTAKCIAEYVGLVDSISKKITRLSESELNAAVDALRQALGSDAEAQSLLREARNRFNKAAHLETDLRLSITYLGLALCHYHLRDKENYFQAIENFALHSFDVKKNLRRPMRLRLPFRLWGKSLVEATISELRHEARAEAIEKLVDFKQQAMSTWA